MALCCLAMVANGIHGGVATVTLMTMVNNDRHGSTRETVLLCSYRRCAMTRIAALAPCDM